MGSVQVTQDLKPNPENDGWYLGWGVAKNSPWHLAAVCASEDEATAYAQKNFVEPYRIGYGSHRLGTDEFIFSE